MVTGPSSEDSSPSTKIPITVYEEKQIIYDTEAVCSKSLDNDFILRLFQSSSGK